jgi:hypothetical protein
VRTAKELDPSSGDIVLRRESRLSYSLGLVWPIQILNDGLRTQFLPYWCYVMPSGAIRYTIQAPYRSTSSRLGFDSVSQSASIRSEALVHSSRTRDFCSSGLVWHTDTGLWSPDTVVILPVHCDSLRYRPVCNLRPPPQHLEPARF